MVRFRPDKDRRLHIDKLDVTLLLTYLACYPPSPLPPRARSFDHWAPVNSGVSCIA